MYVCIYLYIYIYICTHTYTHTHLLLLYANQEEAYKKWEDLKQQVEIYDEALQVLDLLVLLVQKYKY